VCPGHPRRTVEVLTSAVGHTLATADVDGGPCLQCVACGAYATTKPKDLLHRCKGMAGRGPAGAYVLKCFARGRLPATGEVVRGIWSLEATAAIALEDLDPSQRRLRNETRRTLVRCSSEGALGWAVRRPDSRGGALNASAARPEWAISQIRREEKDRAGGSAERAQNADYGVEGLCVPSLSCLQLMAQARCGCGVDTATACKACSAPVCLECRKKRRPHRRQEGS
jgi:hypothetical protein